MTSVSLVVEGILLFLWASSISFGLFIAYAAYLFSKEQKAKGVEWAAWSAIGRGLGLLFLIFFSLACAHWSVENYPDTAIVALIPLLSALGVCGLYYFHLVRSHWDDDRIRYAVLLWTALWILVCLLIVLVVWIDRHEGKFQIGTVDASALSQYVNTFAQVAGILVAATMVILTNRHNAIQADETARDEIYQRLEIQSIELFRFETDHPELVARLWHPEEVDALPDDDKMPPAVRSYQMMQYICQILNLFEMACRFRRKNIIETDVFGSWVIWIWELCNQPPFQQRWLDGLQFNYVQDFRNLMNTGIAFASAPESELSGQVDEPEATDRQRQRAFFRYVADTLVDDPLPEKRQDYVTRWLGGIEGGAPGLDREHIAKFWAMRT